MTKSKIEVNYTPESVAKMVSIYQDADCDITRKEAVAFIADSLGKTTRSVIAKLSREQVYVKPTPVTKTGTAIVTKKELVHEISDKLELDFSDVASLGKASKAALEILRDRV